MRWTRIAIVTAGLIVAGGVFGTIAGFLMLGAWVAALEGPWAVLDSFDFLLAFSIAFGGGLGAFLGPLAAWTLMRRVPLWLAVGGTTLGTLASGGLTLLITGHPFVAMLVGVLGFMTSAVALNTRFAPDDQPLLQG